MSMVVQSDQEKRAKLSIYRAVVQCRCPDVPLSTHVKSRATVQGFNKGPNAARVSHQASRALSKRELHIASQESKTGPIGLAVAGDAIKRGRFIDHGFRLLAKLACAHREASTERSICSHLLLPIPYLRIHSSRTEPSILRLEIKIGIHASYSHSNHFLASAS